MLAATTAYVPPVRNAVHHATRPAPKAQPNRARPQRTAAVAAPVPCPPAFANAPIVPQSTFAAAVPPDGVTSNYFGSPSSVGTIVGGGVPGSNVGGGGPGPGGGPGTGGPGGGGGETPLPAVPEPATWSMMLLGFGLLGAALRSRAPAKVRAPVGGARRSGSRHSLRRRRRSVGLAGGGILWSLLEPVQAMTAGIGGGSKMSLLAKAAMCVCPPALMVTAVATVPQARKAVFAATAPQVPAGVPAAITPPCDPNIPVVTGV
ncbi:PEPxxWA-CTERM sorting domain-containing protein [Sphingomonas sp. Tas61C01]|uniref:PEPxxWA-CTERM sorting domain-containing protein n=1 Tax=Sphingomonas sp. Tas61C01 TaxID=3458297 RepID=UPI00403E695B